MLKFSEWLAEDKASYSNQNFDKKHFPKVDSDYLAYSKASRKSLKKLCVNYKLDPTGTKKQLITRILGRLNNREKVKGYYNKVGHSDFAHVKAKNKAAGDDST